MKIIITALFSVQMLGQVLTAGQVMSVVLRPHVTKCTSENCVSFVANRSDHRSAGSDASCECKQ
jgi:hypothetical protein